MWNARITLYLLNTFWHYVEYDCVLHWGDIYWSWQNNHILPWWHTVTHTHHTSHITPPHLRQYFLLILNEVYLCPCRCQVLVHGCEPTGCILQKAAPHQTLHWGMGEAWRSQEVSKTTQQQCFLSIDLFVAVHHNIRMDFFCFIFYIKWVLWMLGYIQF